MPLDHMRKRERERGCEQRSIAQGKGTLALGERLFVRAYHLGNFGSYDQKSDITERKMKITWLQAEGGHNKNRSQHQKNASISVCLHVDKLFQASLPT